MLGQISFWEREWTRIHGLLPAFLQVLDLAPPPFTTSLLFSLTSGTGPVFCGLFPHSFSDPYGVSFPRANWTTLLPEDCLPAFCRAQLELLAVWALAPHRPCPLAPLSLPLPSSISSFFVSQAGYIIFCSSPSTRIILHYHFLSLP